MNGGLGLKDFYVDPDISRAKLLPAWTFYDKAFLELELETIFEKSWLLLPQRRIDDRLQGNSRTLTDEARLRGSFTPFTLLGHPLYLWRDYKQSELHCYLNSCTHARYQLVEGPGRASTISCGQHGRKFHCEGRCIAHAGFQRSGLSEEFNLEAFPVKEWSKFVFMSFGECALGIDELLGDMQSSIARIPLDALELKHHISEVRIVEGNWKQYAMNYLDRYHLGFIHPPPNGLADLIDYSSYTTELYPYSCLQWAYAKDPELGLDPRMLPRRFRDADDPNKRIFALWWFVFPNMVFMFFPWGLAVYSYMPVPDDPSKTCFYWYQFALDEEKYANRNLLWRHKTVNDEDVDAMYKVLKGTASRFSPRGQFAPEEEKGAHWFHHLVYMGIVGGATA